MSLALNCRKVNLFGIKVYALRMDDVLDIVDEHITNREKLLIGVVNSAKIVNMQKDSALRSSLNEAGLVVADGAPVVWLSRMIGEPLPARIAGIDIMYKVLEEANKKRYSVYFLGAKPEVLKKAIETVQKDYPFVNIAGYRDGYFSKEQERRVAEDIKGSCADVLFVGISSPKKEKFLGRWYKDMNVPVCHGVGGSFDILAGVVRRAPMWMQRWGLEWFYRVMQEPGKMLKRYLVTNTLFIKASLQVIMQVRFNKLCSKVIHKGQ